MEELGSGLGRALGGLAGQIGSLVSTVADGFGRLIGGAVRAIADAGPIALGLVGLVLLAGLVLVARR